MKKLRAVAFSFVMTFTQVLPVWAQGAPPAPPPPPPPPPSPSPPPVTTQGSGPGNMPGWSGPSLSVDICKPTPIGGMPLTMNPPAAWRGKIVRMYVDIREDGTPSDVRLVGPSGDAALDAAAIAHARQTWHWAPLICGRKSSGQDIVVVVPRANCQARTGWRPPPPLALAQPRRGVRAAVMVTIAPDGRMTDAAVDRSSGDAALDAAFLDHVRQTWRFYPMAEGCDAVRERFLVTFPEAGCVPVPIRESQTLPEIGRQDRPRAVTLQVAVAQDGKPLFTNVMQSSGDAGLDAAAAAQVKAAWRWTPISCARVQPVNTDRILPVIDTVRVAFP